MPEVDLNELDLADKVLCITFIVLIVFINGILILKIVRKPKFFLSPKFMSLLSLAIADIALALFSILVFTLSEFGEIDRPTPLVAATIYNDFGINFIYSFGIMTLEFELVFRHKWKYPESTKLQILAALFFASTPWFLVVSSILPVLITNNVVLEDFYTLEPDIILLGMYSLCDIALPVIAVLFCAFIMLIKLSPRPESLYERSGSNFAGKYSSLVEDVNQMSNISVEQPCTQNHNAVATTTDTNTFRGIFDAPNNVPLPEYLTHESQFPHDTTFTKPAQERRVLLCVALANLICVVPYGAYKVAGATTLSDFNNTFLIQTFAWLSNFRSIITPFFWLLALSNFFKRGYQTLSNT
jgi:hypothetical protein